MKKPELTTAEMLQNTTENADVTTEPVTPRSTTNAAETQLVGG